MGSTKTRATGGTNTALKTPSGIRTEKVSTSTVLGSQCAKGRLRKEGYASLSSLKLRQLSRDFDSGLQDGRARRAFSNFLRCVASVDCILNSPGGVHWFLGLKPLIKARLRKHLASLGTSNVVKLRSAIKALQRDMEFERRISQEKDIQEALKGDRIMVERALQTRPSLVRLIPVSGEGIKNVCAILLASGYVRSEVAKMVGMTEEQLIGTVSTEDIQTAKRRVPEAVTHLADGIVMRDLMSGVAGPGTEVADRIAARRRKLNIDAIKLAKGMTPESNEAHVERQKHLQDRFGVTLDVEEKKNENSDA